MRKFAQNVISALCQIIGKPQGAGPASALTWILIWRQGRKAVSAPQASLGSEVLQLESLLCLRRGWGPGSGLLSGQSNLKGVAGMFLFSKESCGFPKGLLWAPRESLISVHGVKV